MSRKVLVQTVQPVVDGPTFGQGSDPSDLMKSQVYAHDHAIALARDCLVAGADGPLAAGFPVEALGGMTIQVGAGHIIDTLGRSYQMYDVSEVEIDLLPADPAFARIDLICALLEVDAAAASAFKPFIRLRTQAELEEDPPVSPYAPTQLEVATEQHTRATIIVKSSTAAEHPAVPELGANEVALYQILVTAGLTEIRGNAIVALNKGLPSLLQVMDQVNALTSQFNFSQNHPREYTASEIEIGPGAGSYEGKSVQEYVNDQVGISNPLTLPEILTPELARSHVSSGKLGSVGAVDGGVQVVDIPVDRQIVFRSGIQTLKPSSFSSDLNPRIVSKAAGAGTETLSNTNNFSVGGVTEIASDGGGVAVQAVPTLAVPRSRSAVCGRGNRFLEIFSGFTSSETALTDWHTYDVLANTLTPRDFSAPPAAPAFWPAAFSCGIASDEIVLAMGQGPGAPADWYKLNCVTGVLTPLAGGPTGYRFTGDLISPDLIFFISTDTFSSPTFAAEHRYWKFVPSTNTFTQLTPSGTLPVFPSAEQWTGGYYDSGKFLVLAVDQSTLSGRKGKTYVYDSASNEFVSLPIPGPYADQPGDNPNAFVGAVMFPLGGRLVLIGGESTLSDNIPLAYEITPATSPTWHALNAANLQYRDHPGGGAVRASSMTGTYAATVGGRNGSGSATSEVFELQLGGLMGTEFAGEPALTLSPGTTYSMFSVPDLAAGWQMDAVIASLAGSFQETAVKIEYSVDNGVTWTIVPRGVNTSLAGTATSRKLRITLFRSGKVAPILQRLDEVLHKDGGSSFGHADLVLRFDIPGIFSEWWVRLNDDGEAVFETIAQPSTPTSALLLKTEATTMPAIPIIKDYTNKRYWHQLRRGTRAAGATPPIVWDFAVLPQFLKASKVLADGTLKELADATAFAAGVVFDTDIAIGGIGTDGDGYRVDIET